LNADAALEAGRLIKIAREERLEGMTKEGRN
jgi:hypothetical protein